MLLAGDIGGTKTVLAIFEEDANDFDHSPFSKQYSRALNSIP